MTRKITDITKKIEDPESEEINNPLEIKKEVGYRIEVEKKAEAPKPAEAVFPEKVPAKAEEAAPYPAAAPAALPAKSPVLEKIEDVLEEDLEQIYFQMPAEKQAEFAQAGEETASKIAMILSGVKIKVKKILELVVGWLKMIPGVNQYFLEQEAKIKTDKILELKEKGEIPASFEDKNKI